MGGASGRRCCGRGLKALSLGIHHNPMSATQNLPRGVLWCVEQVIDFRLPGETGYIRRFARRSEQVVQLFKAPHRPKTANGN
jgi:hypothetical protein